MRDIDRCDVCQGPLLPDKTCADAECRMAWADPLEPVEDEPEGSDDACMQSVREVPGMQAVLHEVAEERVRQHRKWGAANDDGHSIESWVGLIGLRIAKVVVDPRRAMIQIAALAIAAVESMDRKRWF